MLNYFGLKCSSVVYMVRDELNGLENQTGHCSVTDIVFSVCLQINYLNYLSLNLSVNVDNNL